MTRKKKLILSAAIAVPVLAAAVTAVLLLQASAVPCVEAADFALPNYSGELVRLSDYEGASPVVVTFWASWCPDCRGELPAVYRVAEEYGGEELTFLMVNSTSGVRESREAAIAYLEQEGLDLDSVLFDMDGEAAEAYELYFIPCTLLIDRNGYIVKRYDDILTEQELRQAVKTLLRSG